MDAITVPFPPSDEIRRCSRGEVTRVDYLDIRTRQPIPGGLFCERIFGPLKDWECRCGGYSGREHEGVVCETCGVEVAHSSVRAVRTGHIELVVPVVHFQYLPGDSSPLASRCGISQSALERLVYDDGAEVVRALLLARGAREEAEFRPVLDCLPVIPPESRKLIAKEDGRYLIHDVNDLYRRVINRNARLRKMRALHVPPEILAHERRQLQQAVDALIDNERHPEPLRDAQGRRLWSLADIIPGRSKGEE